MEKNKKASDDISVTSEGQPRARRLYSESVDSVFTQGSINYDAPVVNRPVVCRPGTVDLGKLFPGVSIPNRMFREAVLTALDFGPVTLTSCMRPNKPAGGRRSLHQIGRALDIQLDFLDGHHNHEVIVTLVQKLLAIPAVSMIYTGRSPRGNVIMHIETHSPISFAGEWRSDYKGYHGRHDEFLRS